MERNFFLLLGFLHYAKAYPGNFLATADDIGCYAQVGKNYMSGVVSGDSVIDISFNPPLGENNKFVFNQEYTVTITDSNGQLTGRLLGADGGTFGVPTSGCGDGTCGESRSGFGSCYPCTYAGNRTNFRGYSTTGLATCGADTSNYVVTWIAPGEDFDRDIDFGTSRAHDYGLIYTKSMILKNPDLDYVPPSPAPPAPPAPQSNNRAPETSEKKEEESGLSAGAIAGIVSGGILVVGLVAYFMRIQTKKVSSSKMTAAWYHNLL